MSITYKVNFEITIIPIYHNSVPEIKYGINDNYQTCQLIEKTVLRLNQRLPEGNYFFNLNFFNKTDADCILEKNLDKFLTISSVKICGLELPRFLWMSEYIPIYPEPWYSQQEIKPPNSQFGATILGHNGIWRIPFENPIFPWIHKIEKMGWVWPID